jgi:hypothetical protein
MSVSEILLPAADRDEGVASGPSRRLCELKSLGEPTPALRSCDIPESSAWYRLSVSALP